MFSEPLEGMIDQFLHRPAAVVAGDRLVQVPPDAFGRVRFGGVLRKQDQYDAGVLSQVLLHGAAGVELGVVADDVNAAIAAQSPSQVIEVREEQIAVAAGAGRRDEHLAGPPVD